MENIIVLVLQESLLMVLVRGKRYFIYIPIRQNEDSYDCLEFSFKGKPTIEEIGTKMNLVLNEYIEDKITNGYTWNDFQVYLSKENQMTYKMLYDYSREMSFSNLPITIKFGNTGNSTLYQFSNQEDFSNFYNGMVKHIYDTLNEGWNMKSYVDWEKVKESLSIL